MALGQNKHQQKSHPAVGVTQRRQEVHTVGTCIYKCILNVVKRKKNKERKKSKDVTELPCTLETFRHLNTADVILET